MTYGMWLRRAHDALVRAADTQQAGGTAAVDDLYATVVARQAIYCGLARLVELIGGERPVPAGVAGMDSVAGTAWWEGMDAANALHRGLTAAFAVDHRYGVLPAAAGGGLGRDLAAASDAVGAAGDVLASHVPLGHHPATPEGVAIRAGAGRASALSDVAGLARDMIRLDAVLPERLAAGRARSADLYASVVAGARWTTRSGLDDLAARVIDDADGAVRLLGLLDLAPRVAARPVVDAVTARSTLLAVRDWLHRHPGEVTADLVGRVTRLGLEVSALADAQHARAGASPWSRAATVARDLHGVATRGETADVAADLDRLSGWVRAAGRLREPAHGVGDRQEMARLAELLPSVAEVLRVAVDRAARRGQFFIVEGRELQRRPRSLVYHAVTRWRVAGPDDTTIGKLRSALARAGDSAGMSSPDQVDHKVPRLARLAFPAPGVVEPVSTDAGRRPETLPPPRRPAGPGRSR